MGSSIVVCIVMLVVFALIYYLSEFVEAIVFNMKVNALYRKGEKLGILHTKEFRDELEELYKKIDLDWVLHRLFFSFFAKITCRIIENN